MLLKPNNAILDYVPLTVEVEIHSLDNTIYLNWTVPMSLNETVYCVHINDSVSQLTLYSSCDINMTEFSYPTPFDSHCNIFLITVSPVNIEIEDTVAHFDIETSMYVITKKTVDCLL